MLRLVRTDDSDPRSTALRAAMDVEMDERYAEMMAGLPVEVAAAVATAIAAKPGELAEVVLAFADDVPVGHAALRDRGDVLEVKKVFVSPGSRGGGISTALMLELEEIARERGGDRLVLQTGPLQPEAVGLYERLGYHRIEPYGGYDVIPGVLCFEKSI
jgi:GNAT superfamily N-acetyltransferase